MTDRLDKIESAIIQKYTGRTADMAVIEAHPLGELLISAVWRLRQVEDDLRQEVQRIQDANAKVLANLDAAPGDSVYMINSSGEYSRSNPDAFIAVRATLIEQIRAMAAHIGLVRK